jgi:hypothetical protein
MAAGVLFVLVMRANCRHIAWPSLPDQRPMHVYRLRLRLNLDAISFWLPMQVTKLSDGSRGLVPGWAVDVS